MRLLLYILILAMPLSALAADRCEEITGHLVKLESEILQTQADKCDEITAASIGLLGTLSSEDQEFFDNTKCKNLAEIDLKISQLETQLVFVDSLKDLQAEVVANHNELAQLGTWNEDAKSDAIQFGRDIVLGATIQGLVEFDNLPELFADPQVSSNPEWESRLRNLCSQSPSQDSPFCGMINAYLLKVNSELNKEELFTFLTQLGPMLDANKKLSENKKQSLLEPLRVERGEGQDLELLTFSDFHEIAVEKKFYDAITPKASQGLSGQAQFIRGARLKVPADSTQSKIFDDLMVRLKKNQSILNLQNTLGSFKQSNLDSIERSNLRVKARWSSLYSYISGPKEKVPCLDLTDEADLSGCIDTKFAPLKSNPLIATSVPLSSLYESLHSTLETSKTNRKAVDECVKAPAVLGWLKNPSTTPPECVQEMASERTKLVREREIMLALRESLRHKEERALRFRQYAYDQLKTCKNFKEQSLEKAAVCEAALPEDRPIENLIAFSSNAMSFVNEDINFGDALGDDDCKMGNVLPRFAAICSFRDEQIAKENEERNDSKNKVTMLTGPERRNRISDHSDGGLGYAAGAAMKAASDVLNTRMQNSMTPPQSYIPRPVVYNNPWTHQLKWQVSTLVPNTWAMGGLQYTSIAGPSNYQQNFGATLNSGVSTLVPSYPTQYIPAVGTYRFDGSI